MVEALTKSVNEFERLWAAYENSPTDEERAKINSTISRLAHTPASHIDEVVMKLVVFSLVSDVGLDAETDIGLGPNRIASDELFRSIHDNLTEIRDRNHRAALALNTYIFG